MTDEAIDFLWLLDQIVPDSIAETRPMCPWFRCHLGLARYVVADC